MTVARRRFAMLDQKATVVLIAVSVVVWLLDRLSGGFLSQWLAYNSALLPTQPWRIVTVLFVHSGVFHILFNMWALFIFGRMLENMLGTWRLPGAVLHRGHQRLDARDVLAPGTWVVGASGAIFGLFAAFFVLQRSLGNNAGPAPRHHRAEPGHRVTARDEHLVAGTRRRHPGWLRDGLRVRPTRNIRSAACRRDCFVLESVVAIALCFVGYAVTVG